MRRVSKLLEGRKGEPAPPETVSFALSAKDTAEIEETIRASLGGADKE